MSKTRSDAKLKNLPDEVQAALWDFFQEDKTRTLKDAVPWLKSEHDVTTKFQRISDWYGDYGRDRRIDDADDLAQKVAKKLEEKPHLKLTPDALAVISNAVFLEAATRDKDVKSFAIAAGVIQRAQELGSNQAAHADKMAVAHKKLELQHANLQRQLKELEMKVADFEKNKKAVEAVMNKKSSGISPDVRDAVRAAMGMSK